MYNVIINKRVLKTLDKIPVIYLLKIKEAVNNLKKNPRPFGCVKLSNSDKAYRFRIGIYRIIYTIEDNILTVEVIKIDHRSNIYK